MRILFIALFVLSITTSVYAREVFKDKELRDIQLIEIKDGSAHIKGIDGKEEEIVIGDLIGREAGIVVEIGKASITIQRGNTRTRIPVTYGFER